MREIAPIIIDSATPMYYSVTDAIVTDTGLKSYTKNLVILKCGVYSVTNGRIDAFDESDKDSILSLTSIKLVNKPDERRR